MENEVDFAPDTVGFPGLGSCMGIVLHTDTGMFGYHCPPGTEDRVRGFSQFVRGHGHYGNVLGLYSGCRFQVRWVTNPLVKWREELKYMATALNDTGLVWGFDMTSPGTGITGEPGVPSSEPAIHVDPRRPVRRGRRTRLPGHVLHDLEKFTEFTKVDG